jgi:hypothetical protein
LKFIGFSNKYTSFGHRSTSASPISALPVVPPYNFLLFSLVASKAISKSTKEIKAERIMSSIMVITFIGIVNSNKTLKHF